MPQCLLVKTHPLLFKRFRAFCILPGKVRPGFFLLLPERKRNPWNQFLVRQSLGNGIPDHSIDPFSVPETQFHLGGMHVHIQKFRLNGKMQQHKGKFMLHHKWLICFLYGFCHDSAFNVPAVDEIIFKIPAASCNHRLPHVSGNLYRFAHCIHRKQISCHFPAENGIDNIFDVVVSRSVEPVLIIMDKTDGNVRMGHGDLLYQIRHMPPFRSRRL